jgi:hypothetical protein
MELTLTVSQNSALYLIYRRTARRRATAFRRFTAAIRLYHPVDVRRRTFANSHVSRRFHADNGQYLLRNNRITNQALMSDQNTNSALLRRRSKILQFIIVEVSAIGLLLLVGSFAVLVRWSDSTLAFSINILTIIAAAAVAIIPIAFFAIAPILPRSNKPEHH